MTGSTRCAGSSPPSSKASPVLSRAWPRGSAAPRSLRKELLDAETSFNQILTEERQSLAKRLLAKTAEPVEMIARLTGFSERSAFFRAFKKWTGMTPTEYRNSRRAAMKAAVGPEQER